MVIFESRPDALPQVASLAIASANGLLLKGGKEARNTNEALMRIVKEALGSYGCADAISMVSTREAIGDLLKMDQYIDLIIPRGSGELVKSIKEQSKLIPVLGHAEGVCHVFLDKAADLKKPCGSLLTPRLTTPRPATPWRHCWSTKSSSPTAFSTKCVTGSSSQASPSMQARPFRPS